MTTNIDLTILSTGGTISTTETEEGTKPRLSAEDFVNRVPGLENIANIFPKKIFTKPSTHITLNDMYDIVEKLHEIDNKEDRDAIIITHGTDTIEETSYFVDLCYNGNTPVIFTGAMRKPTDEGNDGPANLLAAAHFAHCPEIADIGPLVVIADRAYTARDVTKTHANIVSAFDAPGQGPVGTLVENRPQITYIPKRIDQKFAPDKQKISNRIFLLTASAEMAPDLVKASENAKGVIIAGTGGGRVPPSIIDGLKLLRNANIPIVMTTRSPAGHTSYATYDFTGGGKELRELEIYFSDLSPWKARIKLSVVLASESSIESSFSIP